MSHPYQTLALLLSGERKDIRAPQLIKAALAYYADFTDEVDEDAAIAEQFEREERERWERQQRAIA
jgi:hypothetical protein